MSSAIPSINEVARMIGDTKAQDTVEKFKESIEKLRQNGQWVVISPRGEMFVGSDQDMIRVLMINIELKHRGYGHLTSPKAP